MPVPKLIAASLAMTVFILAAAGCGGEDAPSAGKLVPKGVNFLLQVRPSAALEDGDLARLYESLPTDGGQPPTLAGLLLEAERETGVDPRQFSSLLVFGNLESENAFAVIANGTFEQDAILNSVAMAAEAEFSTTDYKGYDLHSLVSPDDDEVAVAFLDDETLVFGTLELVRQVVDMQEGDRNRLENALWENFDSQGDPWIKLSFDPPSDAFTDLGEAPLEAPLSLDAFADIDVIGYSLDKDRNQFESVVTLEFTSVESASSATNAIDGAVRLYRELLDDDQAGDLLDKVKVSRDDTILTLRFAISVTEIQNLIESEEIFQGLGINDLPWGDPDARPALPSAAPAMEAPQSASPVNGTPAPAARRAPVGTDLSGGIGVPVPDQGQTHIPFGSPHPSYNTVPPTSGWHYDTPAPWGIYDEQVPNETFVHNMEHGGVIISYNLTEAALIDQLRELVRRQVDSPGCLIMQSYPELDEGEVVLTAWTWIQVFDGVVDIAGMQRFIDAHKNQGPEQLGRTCGGSALIIL
jgi:hypothetical protein